MHLLGLAVLAGEKGVPFRLERLDPGLFGLDLFPDALLGRRDSFRQTCDLFPERLLLPIRNGEFVEKTLLLLLEPGPFGLSLRLLLPDRRLEFVHSGVQSFFRLGRPDLALADLGPRPIQLVVFLLDPELERRHGRLEARRLGARLDGLGLLDALGDLGLEPVGLRLPEFRLDFRPLRLQLLFLLCQRRDGLSQFRLVLHALGLLGGQPALEIRALRLEPLVLLPEIHHLSFHLVVLLLKILLKRFERCYLLFRLPFLFLQLTDPRFELRHPSAHLVRLGLKLFPRRFFRILGLDHFPEFRLQLDDPLPDALRLARQTFVRRLGRCEQLGVRPGGRFQRLTLLLQRLELFGETPCFHLVRRRAGLDLPSGRLDRRQPDDRLRLLFRQLSVLDLDLLFLRPNSFLFLDARRLSLIEDRRQLRHPCFRRRSGGAERRQLGRKLLPLSRQTFLLLRQLSCAVLQRRPVSFELLDFFRLSR